MDTRLYFISYLNKKPSRSKINLHTEEILERNPPPNNSTDRFGLFRSLAKTRRRVTSWKQATTWQNPFPGY